MHTSKHLHRPIHKMFFSNYFFFLTAICSPNLLVCRLFYMFSAYLSGTFSLIANQKMFKCPTGKCQNVSLNGCLTVLQLFHTLISRHFRCSLTKMLNKTLKKKLKNWIHFFRKEKLLTIKKSSNN